MDLKFFGPTYINNINLKEEKPAEEAETKQAQSSVILNKDEAIKNAIEYVMDLKDGRDNYLFQYGYQWFSIYRILVDKGICLSGEYTNFEHLIYNLFGDKTFRVKFIGKDVRKYNISPYDDKFETWNRSNASNTTTFGYFQCIASNFKQKLEENLG